ESQATRRMATVVNEAEWVLHAAHTDLPCLLALGWRPRVLHDTQIAGQILGAERIGLSAMLEAYFDIKVPKDKMARRGDISPEAILRSRDLVDIAGRADRDRAGALRQLNSCLHHS
ncbi:ribonuclease D, partial [Kytococcus schroeteri]